MSIGNIFARLLGINNTDSGQENRENTTIENDEPKEETGTTLQDVMNFVAELQSYYYNDICKMQTDLLTQGTLTESEVKFINKKVKQDKIALKQIDEIFDLIQQKEREYHTIWRKSSYSFYDEIEKNKLTDVQQKVFNIIIKLCEVNTKPELEEIIRKRIDTYQQAWSIDSQLSIPKNYNAIFLEGNCGIEKYRFGNFKKQVYSDMNEYTLSARQLDEIRALKVEFEEEIRTDVVWIRVSSVTRFQLNYMRRTCIIDNDWEYDSDETKALKFDIVNLNEMEEYIKGILQIVLKRKTYAVISLINPTTDMLRVIGPTLKKGDKIEIIKKYGFCLKERSGVYKGNLMTARIDRRDIPEILTIKPYLKFRSEYF